MIPGSRPHFFVDWQQGKEANLCRQLAAVVHHGVGRRTLWPRPSLIRRHHPRLPPLVCTNRISSADSNKKKFQMRQWACPVGRCGRMAAAERWSQGRRWPETNPAVGAARCSSSWTRCRPDVRAPHQCTCQSSGWSADPVSYPSRRRRGSLPRRVPGADWNTCVKQVLVVPEPLTR